MLSCCHVPLRPRLALVPCCSSCSATQLPLLAADFLHAASLPQIGYGATILSFLGGVHWGLAMTNVGGEGCCYWLGWYVSGAQGMAVGLCSSMF